jgi:hypothetical protein
LRRGQVKEWLGLDDNEVTKWIEEGILKPKYFRTGSRAFFIRKDIEILINSEASI